MPETKTAAQLEDEAIKTPRMLGFDLDAEAAAILEEINAEHRMFAGWDSDYEGAYSGGRSVGRLEMYGSGLKPCGELKRKASRTLEPWEKLQPKCLAFAEAVADAFMPRDEVSTEAAASVAGVTLAVASKFIIQLQEVRCWPYRRPKSAAERLLEAVAAEHEPGDVVTVEEAARIAGVAASSAGVTIRSLRVQGRWPYKPGMPRGWEKRDAERRQACG